MWIVGRSHKRGIARSVFLGGTIDGASVHLALAQRLLQRSVLTGRDGIQLIDVHQQVVGKGHLLIELVRQVQMIQIVRTQMWRQQAHKERCLATTLSANQRRHALITMNGVHLKPVSHS